MNKHKIIQLGTFLEQDDKQVFFIDTDKWSRARNLNIKEKDRPIIKETDFMTFDDVEIYINSMEKEGWLFQSIQPFRIFPGEKDCYYAFFKKSIKK